jgi:hypothetical protein
VIGALSKTQDGIIEYYNLENSLSGVERFQEAVEGAFGGGSECSSLVRQDVFQAALEVPINLSA